MNKESTSIRLKYIMVLKKMRQIDILNACIPYCQQYNVKMNKSDISQYVSGKVEPNQEKLFILGKALNVSEAWLMGFDVPIERYSHETNEQIEILNYYDQLNDIGKKEAIKRIEELTHIQKYTNIVKANTTNMATHNHLAAQAAHNDYVNEPGELEKMQKDIELLKRPT